ncbi:hypothetical protein [Winogradskyella sp.]|uniref:hypothetical protein n=1 Tax=Winogradskyella sp. TaxID=1883156 RepID=UPI001B00C143|nr:hypothetical protein [Winogradskyella sp.]MBO6880683.1 hypothetical protein [Winogradskyella sp.]
MKAKQILFIVLIISFNFAMSQKRIYIDEKGDTLSKSEIKPKLNKLGNTLNSWTYIGKDGKKYIKLSDKVYLKGNFDYEMIKTEIEKITNLELADSVTIIIQYYYKDDFCTDERKDNVWSRGEINRRKSFIKPIKKFINAKDMFFISLFEKGIELKNKKNNEYFFSDENNFFRDNIFLNPTTCGSYAAIKSNGETLIRNGEYRADWFSNHLIDENWSLFFNDEKD